MRRMILWLALVSVLTSPGVAENLTITPPIAGQIKGTITNDNAAAGDVGEFFTNTGTAVSVSSGAATDIASQALTAGDWEAWCAVFTNPATGTTTSQFLAWLSITSATDPGPPNSGAYNLSNVAVGATLSDALTVNPIRISTASAPTIFCSVKATFAVSTMTVTGTLNVRRRR